MTAADSKAFAAILHGLGEIYGESVSPLRAELYFRALDDLSLEDVKRAANLHTRRCKFFPKPAELREAVAGPVEDRAELAWSEVRALVRRYGWPGVDGRGTAPEAPGDSAAGGMTRSTWPTSMTLGLSSPFQRAMSRQF